MKRQDIKQLHNKTNDELLVLLKDLKQEVRKNKLDMSINKLKNINFVKQKKKDIARILTILKEKEEEKE